jgi:hypothetical protein
MDNGFGQPGNVGAGSLSVIDKDQSLAVTDTGIALSEAFETTLLNQPSGRDLKKLPGGVVGDVGKGSLDVCKQPGVNDRVHEETTGIAKLPGVGEFGASKAYDGLSHVKV